MTAARGLRVMRRLGWTLAGLALVAVVAWRLGSWSPAADGSDVGGPVGGQATPALNTASGLDLYPAGQRVPAPNLQGTTLDGKPWALADQAGTIVVINVWGSWCGPCRAEAPDLVRLANQNADRGVRFVGVNTRDNPAAAQAFVRSFAVPYPSIRDDNGQVLLAYRGLIPTSVVPTTVVVDRDGKVAARVLGRVTYRTLQGILDDEVAASKGRR